MYRKIKIHVQTSLVYLFLVICVLFFVFSGKRDKFHHRVLDYVLCVPRELCNEETFEKTRSKYLFTLVL